MSYLKDELYNLIKNNESIFDFIQDSALDGLWYWDIENPEEEWMNPKFWVTLGYNPDEMPHKSSAWQDIIHPDDLKIAIENFTKHCENPNHPYDQVVRYTHKNNSTVWIRCRGLAVRNANGTAIRMLGAHTDITQQKLYEEDLKQLISRYDHIIDGSDIGTWEWNIQTGETIFNERWANIIGYTLAELKPTNIDTWSGYAHPDDLIVSGQLLQQHFDGKTSLYDCEARMKHKNGHWIWVQDKGKVVSWTADGKPEWMTGSHQDITERKTNELLLLKYKELLDRTNHAATIGNWEVDLVNNTVYWSPVTKLIHEVATDYQPKLEEAINFFPEGENRDYITKVFNAAIKNGENYDIELQILTATQKLKWVRAIGIAVIENNKTVRIYGLFQDIDEKKRALNEIILKEEQFRKTFEYAAIGMALVGLDGRWLQVNNKLCAMLGYTAEELLQLSFQEITHADDLELDLQLVKELLGGLRDSYQMEKRYYHKNGSIVWVLLAVSLIKNDAGEPMHFVSQIKDITERKHLYETVKDQNSRLLNFAHIVSHNLRSHTSNLALMLDLMEADAPEATQNQFFPLIQKATGNLKETIAHLNEITLIQTKTSHNLTTLNLSVYIEKAIDNIIALIKDNHCTIINNANKAYNIIGVPAYLESIVLNFLTNAIKYKHPERNPIIEITTDIVGEYVRLTIKDNGLGIDLEANGQKLFGMYKTFHGNKDAQGIGLFITKNQVDAMGGKIELESEVNVGTTFFIYLKHE